MAKHPKSPKRRNTPPPWNRTPRVEQEPGAHQQNSLSRGSLLGILGILLTLVLGAPAYFSRVGIGSREVDVLLPFSASFPVSNQGSFNLYSVFHACHINEMTAGRYQVRNSTNGDLSASRTLKPGDTSDVMCVIHTGGQSVSSADIDIIVYYRPAYSPIVNCVCAKFTLDSKLSNRATWRQSPGKNCRDIWVPEPLRKTLTLPNSPAVWFW
jgi:hypothetical protein